MKLIDIQVSKIIYSHNDKKYKVVFSDYEKKQFFTIFLSAEYAKKIAMSHEGIKSESLSSYDLFINVLSIFKIKLEKIVLFSKNKKLYSSMYLISKNKQYKINSSLPDSIILSLKTFSRMEIDSLLLTDKGYFIDEMKYKDYFDTIDENVDNINESKIDILKKVLIECIEDEKYESAAIIRDRIKKLTN